MVISGSESSRQAHYVKRNWSQNGKGKGDVEGWVAVVKPGKIMFEIGGVPDQLGKRGP